MGGAVVQPGRRGSSTRCPAELVDWQRAEATPVVDAGDRGGGGPAAATSPGNRAGDRAAAGDRVSHDTFGLGTVVSTAGEGEQAEATSTSATTGVKRLLLRYAPVEKL